MEYVYVYIYKFSPQGFSEPVYKYIQGQTVEGLRKSARAAHILRHINHGCITKPETLIVFFFHLFTPL